MDRKFILLGIFPVLIALCLWPSGVLAASKTPPDTLVVAYGVEPSTLDPHLTTDSDSAAVRYHIYDYLFVTGKDADAQPQLATKVEVSPDKLTWTFTLRQGVKYHDGTELNAQTVKENWDRLLDPKRVSSAKNYYLMIDKVQATGPYTIQFHTREPLGPMLRHIAHIAGGAILSPEAAKRWGDEFGRHPVGSGPFRFVEWVKGTRVVLERNEEYWGKKPKIRRIEYRPVPESSARAIMLETGEADIAVRIPPHEAPRLRQNRDIDIIEILSCRAIYMALNMEKPPTDNIKVRKAINYAVNNKAIVEQILMGSGQIMDCPVAPNVFGYHPTMVYEYDPQKARQLLKEAGYKGEPVTMWSSQGRYLMDTDVAQAVQNQLKEVGINAQLRIWGDWPAYLKAMADPDANMTLFGWAPSTIDAEGGLFQISHSSLVHKFANASNYANKAYDALLDKGRTSLDPKERLAAYKEASKIFMEDAPWLFLFYQKVLTGVRKNVKGVWLSPAEHLIMVDAWKE
jgi:peptide/nickel transport system substrate-binding protein